MEKVFKRVTQPILSHPVLSPTNTNCQTQQEGREDGGWGWSIQVSLPGCKAGLGGGKWKFPYTASYEESIWWNYRVISRIHKQYPAQSDISHFQLSVDLNTAAGTVNNISWGASRGDIIETYSKEMPPEVLSGLLLWLSCLKNISCNVLIGINLTVICDYFPKETTNFYHLFKLSFVLIL